VTYDHFSLLDVRDRTFESWTQTIQLLHGMPTLNFKSQDMHTE